ncbi:thiosulfate oxidation carrier protein SoxY [Polynucleobacter kasalickyi]|uniref:thiosulfate oxidation carrier protein SoxY n=1 Tax=Polynucleobacter kasalickyi TaxID=1938817 RepID=UPI00135BC951|nr:thiosulfate oxidation carrier protein SoxY [Polynucleobacter kasalickyi]
MSKSTNALAQKMQAVQTMQSQYLEYQPVALKKLAIDAKAIELDIPPLADTGNSIPFTIKLIAPADRLIQSFEIIAPENPFPMVLRGKIPKASKSYQFSTRIRLALSQDVWVIVTLDNGQKIANSVPSVVTLNACFDAT